MSKKAFIFGLFVVMIASMVGGAFDANAAVYRPNYGLSCSPSSRSISSGEYVSFTAYSDYSSNELTWTAVGGHPSSGAGSSFGTRFYSQSINETREITVTDGYRTATCTVYVYGTTPTWTPVPTDDLRCSPATISTDSDTRVNFRAYGGNGSYSWSAVNGSPTSGYNTTFQTRFTNTSWYSQYQYVTVTSGWQTATCSVLVSGSGSQWTPTPYPYNDTLRCSADMSSVNSGGTARFHAYGGDEGYTWYAADGSPSNGYDSTFQTRFYNSNWNSQYRTATVTSGGQTATCGVNVIGTGSTWTPTPTAYPYVDYNAHVQMSQVGRNVTRGQSGEFASLTARGGDTLDIIVRITAATGSDLSNAYVTDLLPAGLVYISGSTSVNGYAAGDGITSSGINVGTVTPGTHTTVKFSVRVDESAVPTWGTVTVSNTAQVRGNGVGTTSLRMPITLGTSASIAAVSAVKTGPGDAVWMAFLLALIATGAYAAYTRTDIFGRRMALAEISKLTKSSSLNFSK